MTQNPELEQLLDHWALCKADVRQFSRPMVWEDPDLERARERADRAKQAILDYVERARAK